MTSSPDPLPPPPTTPPAAVTDLERTDRFAWTAPAAGIVLATIGSVACLRLAGPSQGVLFGACGIVVLLVPTLAAGRRTAGLALAVALATAAGALVGPTLALRAGDLNLPAWLAAVAVAAALAAAAAGLVLLTRALASRAWPLVATAVVVGTATGVAVAAAADGPAGSGAAAGTAVAAGVAAAGAAAALLVAVRASPSVAGWLVTVGLLAWLAWPVWLSPWLAGRDAAVHRLSAAHPLLAVDAALTRQGLPPWTEHRLMYGRLTVLQQHVAASPPPDVVATVLLHLGAAAAGFAMPVTAAAVRAARGRRKNAPAPAARD
jgi:hypothetical protein